MPDRSTRYGDSWSEPSHTLDLRACGDAMSGIEGVDGTLMLESGHYEIEYHRGGSQTITNLVYDARQLPAAINGIINTGGTIMLIRTVEE